MSEIKLRASLTSEPAQQRETQHTLNELQRVHLVPEFAEFGAILTLPMPALTPQQQPYTGAALAPAQKVGVEYLNYLNQELMKCLDEQALLACLTGAIEHLIHATQIEIWLYDRTTRKLKTNKEAAFMAASHVSIEAVFATGEARRGSFASSSSSHVEIFYLGVPLLSSKNIFGVCYLSSTARAFTREELELLTAIGHQVGAVLETLHVKFEQERSCENLIQALALTIDARDEITAGHSGRVANYSAAIARYLKLSEREQRLAYYAGLLHDYGKIGVRDDVLCKPSQLTAEEYEEIKQHPQYTFSILSKIKFSDGLVDVPHVASCHHERPDGKGYPRGLQHPEIPICSLIIAVADVFDALTVKRHYRDPMPLNEVMELVEAGRDTQFDGTVIDAFKQFFELEYLPRWHRNKA